MSEQDRDDTNTEAGDYFVAPFDGPFLGLMGLIDKGKVSVVKNLGGRGYPEWYERYEQEDKK